MDQRPSLDCTGGWEGPSQAGGLTQQEEPLVFFSRNKDPDCEEGGGRIVSHHSSSVWEEKNTNAPFPWACRGGWEAEAHHGLSCGSPKSLHLLYPSHASSQSGSLYQPLASLCSSHSSMLPWAFSQEHDGPQVPSQDTEQCASMALQATPTTVCQESARLQLPASPSPTIPSKGCWTKLSKPSCIMGQG